MQLKERVTRIGSHFKFEVFDGDVERRPLTKEQIRENRVTRKILGLPAHIGAIVSRPIDTFEFDNLVVTTGKNILLDRLFGLGTPPAAINSFGVGNSATAAAIGDVQLLGSTPAPYWQAFDALPTRAGLVVTSVTTVATGNGNQNWQECAQGNALTNASGTMFNRIAPIGPFNKTSAVSIAVTITTTQS